MDEEKTTLTQDVEAAEDESVVDTDDDDLGLDTEDYEDDWDDDPEDEWDELDDETKQSEDEQFTVKYNGEEKQLTRAEMIEAAQKGLNYDKIKERLDSVQTGDVYKAMKAGADKAKMSIEDYAKYLLETSAADEQLDAEREIREKYPTAPAEMIKEMAALRKNTASGAAATAAETAEQKAWADALREYPEIKPDAIPEDVQKDVAAGATPLQAMKDHEIRELKDQIKKLKAEEKNKKNKETSIGSLRGRQNSADPFLEGYDTY